MGANNRFASVEQFESEAAIITKYLGDAVLLRVRDAMASAQGFGDAAELISVLSKPSETSACLEMRSATGELYLRSPTPINDAESWVSVLTRIAASDPELAVVETRTLGDGTQISEGFLNVELLGLDRLSELSDLIEDFCTQNPENFARGELFTLMSEALMEGAADPNSDINGILTDAYAAVIEGCEVDEIIQEEVNLWVVLGKYSGKAVKLARLAYSQGAMEDALRSLSLRGKGSDDAAAGVLMERDFRMIVEVMFATIMMQSDPGCIDADMMANYATQYEDGMVRNARLSVFAGERLLA